MKRFAFTGLLVVVFISVFFVGSRSRISAQGTTNTGTPAPAITPAPGSHSSDDILAEANKASADASQAVNMVNTMLSFIQVVGVLGGLIAALGAGAFAVAGLRTIGEYRGELDGARQELTEMRNQLNAATQQVLAQGNRSIRAISLMQLGEQPLESKNTKAALRIYREAHNLDPSNRAINYFLGELNIQENNIDQGIELLQKVLESESDFPPAEAALAYALRLRGDRMENDNERNQYYAEAEARFLKAIRIDPAVRDVYGESIYGVLGGLYKRQDRIEDAIRCYKEAEQITPHRSYPVVNLATLYFLTGQRELAENYFRRSLTLAQRALDNNPFDYWTRFDLTMAMLILGNADDALKNVDVAIQQVQSSHPLEVFLSDLRRMKEAPYPPTNVDLVIERVQQAIIRLTS